MRVIRTALRRSFLLPAILCVWVVVVVFGSAKSSRAYLFEELSSGGIGNQMMKFPFALEYPSTNAEITLVC